MTPENLLYAKTHEWVRLETGADGSKLAVIGVTQFAVEALTDLVFIELPKAGAQVRAGEPFGEIESVKAVSDLYCPVTGDVVEVNAALASDLGILNTDPYQAGWMVKVRITDEAPLKNLMRAAAYDQQCREENH